MLQLTISNLTDYPVTAVVPVPTQEQRRSARQWLRQGVCCETSEVVLGPQLEHLATLPRRFRKAVTLRSKKDAQGAFNSDFKISIWMPPEAIWRHVFVPEGCPWRVYILKVRLNDLACNCKFLMLRMTLGRSQPSSIDNIGTSELDFVHGRVTRSPSFVVSLSSW